MMQLQFMRSRRMEKISAGQIQLKGYLRSCEDIKGLNKVLKVVMWQKDTSLKKKKKSLEPS